MEDLKRDDLNPDTNERNEEAFSYFKNFTRMSPEDFDYLQEAIAQSGSKNVKQGNRGDMRKIHVTRQFFEAGGPQGHFFKKDKKHVFSCGLGERVHQISGVYRFRFGHEA